MKRYEASYANRVLAALAERADSAGVVEVSVRSLAEAAGVSASAVQIGLTTLRRSGRIKTRRKGAAGRPSLIEITDADPLPEANGTTPEPADRPSEGDDPRTSESLAGALIERYERLLVEVEDARRAPSRISGLESRVAELERENAELRARLDSLLETERSRD